MSVVNDGRATNDPPWPQGLLPTYRFPARVSETLQGRLKDLPLSIRSIAWNAQVRLCAHYRRLIANGKKTPVATSAIARRGRNDIADVAQIGQLSMQLIPGRSSLIAKMQALILPT
jgi:hypothetical protein